MSFWIVFIVSISVAPLFCVMAEDLLFANQVSMTGKWRSLWRCLECDRGQIEFKPTICEECGAQSWTPKEQVGRTIYYHSGQQTTEWRKEVTLCPT